MIEHEPPDVLEQFGWKPWTTPPESPKEPGEPSPPSKRKEKPKKKLVRLKYMEKVDLVKELQWQHPTRVLNVGTVNSNATRALAKDSLSLDYLPRIKRCLSRTTQLAIKTKRTCQQAIGRYLENLLLDNLDSMDKLVLGHLCCPFNNKDAMAVKQHTKEGSEEYEEVIDDSEDSRKNPPLQFFMSLLSAIYNAEPPVNKQNESNSVKAVRAFLIKAKDFLPPQNGRGKLFFQRLILIVMVLIQRFI